MNGKQKGVDGAGKPIGHDLESDYLWEKLDRIERMLKWLVIEENKEKHLDFTRKMKMGIDDKLWKRWVTILPDISDIVPCSVSDILKEKK